MNLRVNADWIVVRPHGIDAEARDADQYTRIASITSVVRLYPASDNDGTTKTYHADDKVHAVEIVHPGGTTVVVLGDSGSGEARDKADKLVDAIVGEKGRH